jgi:hypothetical protein
MNLKKYIRFILLLLTVTSCSRVIEVPENKAAVVYDRKNQIDDVVLRTGSHTIDFLSDVSLYDISEQKTDFKFDILFYDASAADIDFSITYVPKVDDLAKICQKYQQRIDQNTISYIVLAETRAQIRALLIEMDKSGLDEEQIFTIVEQNIKNENPAAGIIEIKSFSPGKVNFRN